MNLTPEPAGPIGRGRAPKWQRIVLGGLIGAAIGFGGAKLALALLPADADLPTFTTAQGASMMLGVMALGVGLIILAMSFSRRFYESENWSPEASPEEHRIIAPQLRLTAVAMLAMAAEFVALGLPVDPNRAALVVGVVVVSLLLQLWVNVRVWQNSDELYRAVVLDGSAISLALVLTLLTIWAPLAIYGLVGFDPLAVILLVSVACIIPTIWLTVQRGLTQ